VSYFWFLLGLSIGLAVWKWQQYRTHTAIELLLQEFNLTIEKTSLSSISRLAGAIATQQQRLQSLEEQLESHRRIVYSAPIGFLQVDDENQLIWCNPQARELLDIAQEQYSRPRLLLEVVRSFELDRLIEQTRNTQKPSQSDWTFYPVSPDPSKLSKQQPYALRGYGLPLSFGHVGVFLENRQEALTLMQQRDRWASDVAHELKTPLTSIRLVAETLQSRLEPPLRNWVDRLINETVRLSNLVQDLLDLSHIDRGASHALQLKTIDMVELIQSAWLNLEPLARKKQLHIEYSGLEKLVIAVDEPRIYRVLVNLLDNSIKYSPPSQVIRVHLNLEVLPTSERSNQNQTLDPKVCLEVIDAGPGFAEVDLPHVFERFYRADPSRSRTISPAPPRTIPPSGLNVPNTTDTQQIHGQDRTDLHHRSGSGLGLSIVKQIVEAHYGTVSASNHPETGGAWLKVYLPQNRPELVAKTRTISSNSHS
jgi:two-component system phosphate regulon sensor histidine kinase PhoR